MSDKVRCHTCKRYSCICPELRRKKQFDEIVQAALVVTINLSYTKRRKTKAERRLMEACGIYAVGLQRGSVENESE